MSTQINMPFTTVQQQQANTYAEIIQKIAYCLVAIANTTIAILQQMKIIKTDSSAMLAVAAFTSFCLVVASRSSNIGSFVEYLERICSSNESNSQKLNDVLNAVSDLQSIVSNNSNSPQPSARVTSRSITINTPYGAEDDTKVPVKTYYDKSSNQIVHEIQ